MGLVNIFFLVVPYSRQRNPYTRKQISGPPAAVPPGSIEERLGAVAQAANDAVEDETRAGENGLEGPEHSQLEYPLVVFPPQTAARQVALSQQAVAEQLPTAVATASRPSLGPSAVVFMLGAALASTFHSFITAATTTSWRDVTSDQNVRSLDPFGPDVPPLPPRRRVPRNHVQQIVPDSESVEWVNMCVRKIWRVYQRGLESWISGLLQPVFDNYINDDKPPAILKRIRIARFTLNHEPPVLESMQRRNSRKESDLNGVCSIRYSGGAKMLLVLELGGRLSGVEIPVMVEDFDLDARMWLKVRLAPMCPWIGVISVAFVEQPRIQVQLNTYGMLPLMRIPVLQRFLRKLLTVELPAAMVLPHRLEINLPPSVTVLAEAAVGRDTVMRAVASAVLQADAMEQALINALPMDAANVASAVTVPEAFVGEVTITVVEARGLPVWGFPWQSNPYCRIVLGSQAVESKRERETGSRGTFRCPNWNQEFQFLVEDSPSQRVQITVYDNPYTGRTEVGHTELRLEDLPCDGTLQVWLPIYTNAAGTDMQGELYVRASYRAFEDSIGEDPVNAEDQEDESKQLDITDVQSAAEASARAAVEASKGIEALAVAKAAAARAAARLRGKDEQGGTYSDNARTDGNTLDSCDDTLGCDTEAWPQAPLEMPASDPVYAEQLVSAVRRQRTDALASELSKQRASVRVTDQSMSLHQETLKKRIVEDSSSDTLNSTPTTTWSAAQGIAECDGDSILSSPNGKRMIVDFDIVAEGDGSSAAMPQVPSVGEADFNKEDQRSTAPPLLPAGLPGPAGRVLDDLMIREATTRVSSVDTEDLAMLGSGVQPGPTANRTVDLSDVSPSTSGPLIDELEECLSVSLQSAGTRSLDGDNGSTSSDMVDIVPATTSETALKAITDNDTASTSTASEVASNDGEVIPSSGPAATLKSEEVIVFGSSTDVKLSDNLEKQKKDASSLLADEDDALQSSRNSFEGTSEGGMVPATTDQCDQDESSSTSWWRWGSKVDSEADSVRNKDSKPSESAESEKVEPGENGKRLKKWVEQVGGMFGIGEKKHDGQEKVLQDEGDEMSPHDSSKVKGENEKSWWDIATRLIRGDDAEKRVDKSEELEDSRKQTSRGQIETVVVSPDLPIAEIAAEIARVKVKEEDDADEKKRLASEEMLQGPLGHLKRFGQKLMSLSKPELLVLCGLSGGVLILLAVVAYRLELYVEYERLLNTL